MNMIALKQLGSFKNGLNFGAEAITEIGYDIIGIPDFGDNYVAPNHNLKKVNSEIVLSDYLLAEDDILFVRSNGNKALVGRTMIVKDIENPTTFSGFCIRYRPDSKKVFPLYMLYLFKSPIFRRFFANNQQTSITNLNQDVLGSILIDLPSLEKQKAIANTIHCITRQIENNNLINDNLAQMLRLLYEQWFYRFEFPNEQNLPYNRANGELEWNDKLKRRIPKGWKVQTMLSNELFSVISSGIDRFSTKKYYATADIIGTSIGEGSDIEYETRESRANMQPVINSIWFAKMKNSIKHLFLNKEMSSFVDNSILSTGFYGLKCNEISFEYIASVVSAPIFEITKDRLSHGATQQGIGDDDMANITLLIPDDTILRKYHEATKGFFAKISNNILENKRLIAIRNFLLPLLMNGQAAIAE